MNCLRIYATPDGESHFEEIEIPLSLTEMFPGQSPFYLSSRYTASRVRFVSIPAGIREAAVRFVGLCYKNRSFVSSGP
jgi:hypothetical protein